jgi:ParB/RepB/Spo0J family partition protein
MKASTDSTPATLEADHGMVPLDLIDADGLNIREEFGALYEARVEEKVASFKLVGQLHPIRLYRKPDGRFRIGYGHLRTEAARRIGWKDIRAEVFPMPKDEREIFDARDRENLDAANLTPLEEMLMVEKAIQRSGGDMKKAADRLGKPVPWVRAHAFVSELDDSVKFMLRTSRILPGHARELAKCVDKEIQKEIAEMGARKADGSGVLRPVEWFRREVERKRKSLKAALWVLSEEFAGKPACNGCPANSLSNPTFFEMGDAAGYCMNAPCYDVKESHADRAIASAKRAVESKAEATGGLATIETIKAATPAFVKPTAVAKEVRVAEGKSEQMERDAKKRAFAEYVAAFDAWRRDLAREITAAAILCNPRWIAYLLLSHANAFIASEYAIDAAAWQGPITLPATSPVLQRLVAVAAMADVNSINELATAERQVHGGGMETWSQQPAIVLTAIATAWGVTIPPEPQLEANDATNGETE